MYQTHREPLYTTDIPYYNPPPSSISNPPPPPQFHSLPEDSTYSHHYPSLQSQLDPYPNPSNYPSLEERSAYYQDPNPASSSWVVKQAAPVRYSSPVQPRIQEPDPPSDYDSFYRNWAIQNANNLTTNVSYSTHPKRPKPIKKPKPASQKVKCKLCKIECTSIELYEKHLSGKKHANTLQRLYAPKTAASQAGQTSKGTSGNAKVDLATKKRKLLEGGAAAQLLRMCTICNVACNGEIAFADHMAGKKHLAQERALANAANPKPAPATNPTQKSAEKAAKKTNASAWCAVCKITCTSAEGLEVHMQGKKHKKNQEKLQNPKADPAPVQPAKSKEPEDVETKKRKVLESGTAEDAVRTCTICNVVCNSETVFNAHLSGQKHATMVKQKEAEEAGTGTDAGEVAQNLKHEETPTSTSS